MDLRHALTRAAMFCAKQDTGPFGHVLTWPAFFDVNIPVTLLHNDALPLPHFPAHVYASDGQTGVCVPLDPTEDVPHVAMEVVHMRKALSAIDRYEGFSLERTSDDLTSFRTESGIIAVPSIPASDVPPHDQRPPITFPLEREQVDRLLQVVHAASDKDPDRPELTCVHLTPWWAEATDDARVARAAVGFVPSSVLVHKRLFQSWPKGKQLQASWGLTADCLILQIGEETRWAKLQQVDKFQALGLWLPEKDHGQRAEVATLYLQEAVKKAIAASDKKIVELAFSAGSCEVRGMREDGMVAGATTLRAPGAQEPVRVVLRGKPLLALTKVLGAGATAIYYTNPGAPVRFEIEGYSEALWPLTVQLEDA